ncbi:hypothetical protein CDD81_3018 [Ophiocordyceps australis]|uniref:Haloacid dehalogenase-like hydrolase n=1 Tax=Ophiocordyceps australis TaxID=1399860 RepID=A0A2C5XCF6_9HYPO|nr:hypothetical protein CDD81_3018 [Ophiocordyceps australis]
MECCCHHDLVFDFDCTITESDTIGVLAEAAIARVADGLQRQLRREAWKRVVEAYKDDYARHEAEYQPAAPQRRTMAAETAWLASLQSVENASLERVGEAQIFAGFAAQDDFFSMGVEALETGCVGLRRGLYDLVKHMSRSNCIMRIVSVNWSQAFIHGVLEAMAETSPDVTIQVAANSIQCPRGTIGGAGLRIATAADKLAAMRRLVAPCEHEGQTTPKTVYFGDSETDLECLLYSRGVAMVPHQDASLLRTLGRLRFDVAHMSSPSARGAKICWARDFSEVLVSFHSWIQSTQTTPP